MAGVELATGWLRLVPSVEGIQEKISTEFMGAAAAAGKEGDKAGGLFGGKFGAAVKGALAIGAVVGAAKGLYEVGAIFDDVADTIRIGTGATGKDLDGLIDVAKRVGTEIPTSFESAGSTVADLNTRLGLSGATLAGVAKQYLEAGRMLGQEVDIGATTAAFSAFKIEGDAVSGAMDNLFRVSQATGVGMNELAAGVQAQAPALQTLGFTFEDSISLLGSLDKAGLNSTAVMASMSKGMVTLAKDGEEPAAAFKRVAGELQGFVDKGDKAAALDLASKVFGTRGAAQFVGALESGVMNMDDLMAATGATGDTILGVAAETHDFAEKWQMTMNRATLAIEPLASAIFDGLGAALDDMMPGIEAFGEWLGENEWAVSAFATVLGVLALAVVGLTVAQWAMNAALLASPITWIVLAIVALVAAIVWVTTQTTFFQDVWAAVMKWFEEAWTNVSAFFTGLWEGIFSFLTDTLNNIGNFFVDTWTNITSFFADTWNNIQLGIRVAFAIIQVIFSTVGATISNIWRGLWSGITGFFDSSWKNIQGVLNTIGAVFASVFNTIANVVKNAFNGVVGAVKWAINGVIDIVNGAIGGINAVLGAAGGAFGIDIKLGKIPRLAQGATILPSEGGTLAVLAEAGRPETVVDTGKMNALIDQALGRGGMGSGAIVNQYITAPATDPAIQARQWAREAARGFAVA